MRFKIDRARLINGKKFTVFPLFYFVFEGNFLVHAPPPGGGGLYHYKIHVFFVTFKCRLVFKLPVGGNLYSS